MEKIIQATKDTEVIVKEYNETIDGAIITTIKTIDYKSKNTSTVEMRLTRKQHIDLIQQLQNALIRE